MKQIKGKFVWWGGYLFFKANKDRLRDFPTIISPEPGAAGGICGEIQAETLELGFIEPRTIPNLPENLKDYWVVYRMAPKSLSVPLRIDFFAEILSKALRPLMYQWKETQDVYDRLQSKKR